MTYQRSLEERDEDGGVEWKICYVCGGKEFHALVDLAGPMHVTDQACETCQKHGAPRERPHDWTRAKSQEVLAKQKVAEPPPPPPRELSEIDLRFLE